MGFRSLTAGEALADAIGGVPASLPLSGERIGGGSLDERRRTRQFDVDALKAW